MKLAHIQLCKLSVSKTNMRYAKRPPDVADILPSIRKRGVIVPVIVRPNGSADTFEIVAGSRRFHAAQIVRDETDIVDPMPCAIMEAGDDAAALEASLIENVQRRDADEVTQWETFTRLIVRERRSVEDIAETFAMPVLAVKRIMALGRLLPRIRTLYRKGEIDAGTIRHLTLASKAKQQEWLALVDDEDAYAPTGQQLKAWLFGGASIATSVALFDLADYPGEIVADLFGEGGYFADAETFWTAQNAAIEARRATYLADGWTDAVMVPPGEMFHSWEHEKTPKAKGGRVYIAVTPRGEVTAYEGYLTRKEARRIASADDPTPAVKPKRPEVTSAMQTYIDLHRHAAVRAAMLDHPGVALRLMVAHAIAGSSLWTVRTEPQIARDEATQESVETCRGEANFDARRRAVLALLDMDPERAKVANGYGGDHAIANLFVRLNALPDEAVMDVLAIVMGETLASGGAAVEAAGAAIGIDMAAYWQADDAFFGLVRDREVLARMVADVAGDTIAQANAKEKGKTLKAIVRDHVEGTNGRAKIEHWVPRWMTFPPTEYTGRGGVGTVRAHAIVTIARDMAHSETGDDDPKPAGPGALAVAGHANDEGDATPLAA